MPYVTNQSTAKMVQIKFLDQTFHVGSAWEPVPTEYNWVSVELFDTQFEHGITVWVDPAEFPEGTQFPDELRVNLVSEDQAALFADYLTYESLYLEIYSVDPAEYRGNDYHEDTDVYTHYIDDYDIDLHDRGCDD